MREGARIKSVMELVDMWRGQSIPLDGLAAHYFRQRRFIGAKDRKDIQERLYSLLRAWSRLHWLVQLKGKKTSTRTLTLLWLRVGEDFTMERLGNACSGDSYSPTQLTKVEKAFFHEFGPKDLRRHDFPPHVQAEVPAWLWPHFQTVFGQRAEAEAQALQAQAPLDLRVNTLKCSPEEAQAKLADEGFTTEFCPFSPHGLRSKARIPLMQSKAFEQGLIEVQDEGSQLVTLLVEAKPGERILDLCSGAGGKALALAASMQNKGTILATDIDAKRLERAKVRFRRASVHNVRQHALSSLKDPWLLKRKASFDKIVVDAPCTGTGTWRRNPDARWRLNQKDLNELCELQLELLNVAFSCLKPGGILVYITCSLLREENEDQVTKIISAASAQSGEGALSLIPFSHIRENQEAQGIHFPSGLSHDYMRLSPADSGTDGFFAAALKKNTSTDTSTDN